MSISKLMIDAVAELEGVDNPKSIAQDVINAAWTKFDPDNNSTWPKTIGPWWVVTSDKDEEDGAFKAYFLDKKFHHTVGTRKGTRNRYHDRNVICYADPQNLITTDFHL